MNKKRSGKAAAVIDIGSNLLKMRISQLKKGEITDLDHLEYPLRLGHEVFHSGKISFECLRELSNVLHGYSKIMGEYGVSQCRVVATTALREALNRDYVTDLLKIQNDMTVEILEDDQEKSLIYSEILRSVSAMEKPKLETALISYIGTGSIGLAVYDGKNIVYSRNISIGSLKLHDMLSTTQESAESFYQVVEEYLNIIVGHIALPHYSIDGLVLTGNEMELIARVCDVKPENGRYVFRSELILNMSKSIRDLSTEKIADNYGIGEEEAEILYSALMIYSRLIALTKSEYIVSPKVELWDELMRQMLIPRAKAEYEAHVARNSLSCAKMLAERYFCSSKHSESVRTFACRIFDKTKSLHGLDVRKRLLLELAAILHDCGYYVNFRQHLKSTFDLIRNMEIYGLTKEEIETIAFIARYDEYDYPGDDELEFAYLNQKKRLAISKLTAIFRLANALDKSQLQKLPDIKVRLDADRLVITGECNEDTNLEKLSFDLCAPFFQEVFGVRPVLTVKSTML